MSRRAERSRIGRPPRAWAGAVLVVLGFVRPSRALEIFLLGGDSIAGASPSQGRLSFAAAGIAWQRRIAGGLSARLELLPVGAFRERIHPADAGPSDRRDVFASAACLLGRYTFIHSGIRPGIDAGAWLAFEAGAGPFYAFAHRVPEGGTRANFYDEIGLAGGRRRWNGYLRFVHVSNLDLQGHRRNPGSSFIAGGIGFRP